MNDRSTVIPIFQTERMSAEQVEFAQKKEENLLVDTVSLACSIRYFSFYPHL